VNRTEEIAALLLEMDRVLRRSDAPPEGAQTDDLGGPTAKFPGVAFDYLDELERLPEDPGPLPADQLLVEIGHAFRGVQRPESKHLVFNLNIPPTVEATAAACLATVYNVNSLMDAFGGEMLLVEQKVARTLGRWAGWPQAMGISTTGGKATMEYAFRTALSRAAPRSQREGLTGRHVVLCNENAHYSVEHVAALVGIGSANCVRVPTQADGTMSHGAILDALHRAVDGGSTVVAVAAAGGTTIDFTCDDLHTVADAVDEFVDVRRPSVRPYLHCDAVIGWAYLATSVPDLSTRPADAFQQRATTIRRRLEGLPRFDSFGADFHKTGLCPYASSFFVAQDRRFMDDLGTGDYRYDTDDFTFGQLRTYRYTAENTRSAAGTLSAWVNLLCLGKQGLMDNLESLHAQRAAGELAIEKHGRFRLLNQHSLGWEIVFDDPVLRTDVGATLIDFVERCWERVLSGARLPLMSIVPEYARGGRAGPALLIYPTKPLIATEWDRMIELVSDELDQFLATGPAGRPSVTWEKPIR
jgi:glutamate/tyrosine decarboxylase-like PLP-dependent enzyme